MNEIIRDPIVQFKSRRKKCYIVALLLLVLLVVAVVFFVSRGAMDISFKRAWQIIYNQVIGGNLMGIPDNEIAVVWKIRLPRILTAMLVGAGLSVAGVMFQSLLRNPLADPYTIGVSTGAAFGASIAIFLNLFYNLMISPTLLAFASAFGTLLLVIFIAQRGGGMYTENLVISGIIVGSILSSGISFIKMLSGESVGAIVFWLMGNLSSKNWSDVSLLVPIIVVSSSIGWVFANNLNVMTMGEKEAKGLGVNTKGTRLLYLVLGSSITAVCVSVGGIIGFVGLVIPHILRYWLTSDNRVLIPLSALLGGLLLLIADNATRLLFVNEVPVGVLTTLIGGPFFIYIFITRRKQ